MASFGHPFSGTFYSFFRGRRCGESLLRSRMNALQSPLLNTEVSRTHQVSKEAVVAG